MHKADKTARAVATVLDLAAVRIENPITKIRLGVAGRVNQQDLVAADAKLAVRNRASQLGRDVNRLSDAIDHDKVVAGAMHFGEGQFHVVIIAKIHAASRKVLARQPVGF